MVVESISSSATLARDSPSEQSNPDTDHTLTRKRQRLTHESNSSRTVSVEPTVIPGMRSDAAATTTAAAVVAPTSSGKRSSSSRASSPSTDASHVEVERPRTPSDVGGNQQQQQASPLAVTSSKVTINVRAERSDTRKRPSSQPSTPPPPEPANADVTAESLSSSASPSSQASSVHAAKPPADDSIDDNTNNGGNDVVAVVEDTASSPSPSSASMQSPEVEIAEVEDMDQDYTVGSWDSLVSVVEPDGNGLLMEKFPFLDRDSEVREALYRISHLMEKGMRRSASPALCPCG